MSKKPSATQLEREKRVKIILPILKKRYPDVKCSLNHKSPFELLVATILSAQCTDDRVNIVTQSLFKKYKTPSAFATCEITELEKEIQSTGFYRNKARSIRSMAQSLVEKHDGVVPQTMEELTDLAGVGRKTANVVLGNAFGKNVGVTVDTHVTRLSNRLGLTRHTDAVKIEQDLIPIIPQADWTIWSHLLIYHGRAVCKAQKPRCSECALCEYCPGNQASKKTSSQ